MDKRILGWREWIALPELKVRAIKVKVDSGAKTSALHAEEVKVLRNKKSGLLRVRFTLYHRRTKSHPIRVVAPLLGFRKVRSSLGHETLRPVITTLLKLGDDSWPIEVTLVNRDIMGFRMLLGRTAIQHGFLIDPSQSYLLPRPQQKMKSKAL